jgi:hypothetical protein
MLLVGTIHRPEERGVCLENISRIKAARNDINIIIAKLSPAQPRVHQFWIFFNILG